MGTVNPNEDPAQQRADIGPSATGKPDAADAAFAEAQKVQHLHQTPPEDPHQEIDTVVKVEEPDTSKADKAPSIEVKDEPTPGVHGPAGVTDVEDPEPSKKHK